MALYEELPTGVNELKVRTGYGSNLLMRLLPVSIAIRSKSQAQSSLLLSARTGPTGVSAVNVDSVEHGQAAARIAANSSLPEIRESYLDRLKSGGWQALTEVNRELWLLLSLFALAALLNSLLDAHRMLLGLYTLPTLLSAYIYGRRHATLTALGSVLLVVLITYFNPTLFSSNTGRLPIGDKWFDITVWGGILVTTAYAMGTLYEHNERHLQELRHTYNGILLILSHFISKDKYTQNHSYRVSVYAARIASQMGLTRGRIEDVRAAALLHDLGKIDVSREILHKAARLSSEEYGEMKRHVDFGVQMLQPVGGPLGRIIPIILAHHDKFDGSGYHPNQGEAIPLEARILSVADAYDAMTSDRPYRKAISSFEAKDAIVKAAGNDFDPKVVEAFAAAFRLGKMEVPEVLV